MENNSVLYVLVQLVQQKRKEEKNMFQLDFGDHRPLYEQIKEKFKELIISGAMTENDKIPSVRELAATLAINPNTIQKAYKDLENEGYIYSQRARGSFVAPQSAVVHRTKNEELYERLDSLLQEIFFCGIGCDEVMKHVRCVYGDCN